MLTIYRWLFVLLFLASVSASAASQLTTAEKQLVEYIKQNTQQQIDFIETLVNINTATNNIAGIAQAENVLKSALEQLSFYTWYDNTPTVDQQAPHLFAKHAANIPNAPTILLLGHIDTIYSAANNTKFSRHNQTLIGPGVLDMKSGDATMIFLLKSLNQIGTLDKINFYVAFTSNEESSGTSHFINTRKELIEVAKKSDYVLEFEPAASPNEATVGIRNYVFWKITAAGQTGHSAKIMGTEIGAGAIYEMVRIANALRLHTLTNQGISTNIGIISGGTQANYDATTYQGSLVGKSNIVPSQALMVGDMRCLTDQQALEQIKIYENIVHAHLPKTTANFTYAIENPAMPITVGNLKLLQLYSNTSSRLDFGAVRSGTIKQQVATDISFAAPWVKQGALSRLGPYGTGMHSEDNEVTNIADIIKSTQLATITIHRLANSH